MDAKNKADRLVSIFGTSAPKVVEEIVSVLSELNQTKMCNFDKEIDFWNEVAESLIHE